MEYGLFLQDLALQVRKYVAISILTCILTSDIELIMASIWKHPKSRFFTACYTNHLGKQVKKSTKQTNPKKALKMALEWEDMETLGRQNRLTTVQIQKQASDLSAKLTGEAINVPSVEKYLNEWLDAKEAKGAAAGTIERYTNTKKLFLAHLGDTAKAPITTLAPKHIEGFLVSRRKGGAAPKTVEVDIKTLSTAFKRAEDFGLILKNPVKAVTATLEKAESMERELFSHEDVKVIMAAAHKTHLDWVNVVLLGYYTGARLTDCARMKWENVNLVEGLISFTQGKTRKRVTIPIHMELVEHLSTIHMEEEGPEDFIAPTLAARTTGGKHGLSESFKRLVKRAGLDTMTVKGKGNKQFSRRTFHSLRYSFNSTLANAGVSQEVRVKFTGHSSLAMNDRYTRLNAKPMNDAIATMPNLDENAA